MISFSIRDEDERVVVTVHNVEIKYDDYDYAGEESIRKTIDRINRVLQREPYGIAARLFIPTIYDMAEEARHEHEAEETEALPKPTYDLAVTCGSSKEVSFTKSFDSKEERNAYKEGIWDAVGWMECSVKNLE